MQLMNTTADAGAALINEPGRAAAGIARPPSEQQGVQPIASQSSAMPQQHSALKRWSPSTALSRLAKLARLSPVVRQPQPGSTSPLVGLHPPHQEATPAPQELQGYETHCHDPHGKVSVCQPGSLAADTPAVAAHAHAGPDDLDEGSMLKGPTLHEPKPSQSKGNAADCDTFGVSEAKHDSDTTGIAKHCHFTCMPATPMLLQGLANSLLVACNDSSAGVPSLSHLLGQATVEPESPATLAAVPVKQWLAHPDCVLSANAVAINA